MTDDPRDLKLELTLDAARASIWRCWTEADLLKQWFAPKPFTTPYAELDVRVGGKALVIMRSPDGDEMENPGVYLEVEQGRREALIMWPACATGALRIGTRTRRWAFLTAGRNARASLNRLRKHYEENTMNFDAKVRTCLWFDNNGHEGHRWWSSLLLWGHPTWC